MLHPISLLAVMPCSAHTYQPQEMHLRLCQKSQEGENGQQLNKGIRGKPGLLLKPELAMRVLEEKPPKILPGLTCPPPRPH